MAGVPLKTAQELMGHKTIQMTARYAHLAPDYLRNAVEMIARVSDVPTATALSSKHLANASKQAPRAHGKANGETQWAHKNQLHELTI